MLDGKKTYCEIDKEQFIWKLTMAQVLTDICFQYVTSC
jgi:hypothetical protein